MRDALTPQQLAELAAQPRDGHGPWSRSDMRLAAIEDQLRVLVYLYTAANSKEGAKVAKPEPVDRPGVTKTGNVRALNADGAAYLAKLRASRGATERPMTLIG